MRMTKVKFDLGELLVGGSWEKLKNKYRKNKMPFRQGTLVAIEPRSEEGAWRFELPFTGHYFVLVLDSENLINTEVNGEGLMERDITKKLLLTDGKLPLPDSA